MKTDAPKRKNRIGYWKLHCGGVTAMGDGSAKKRKQYQCSECGWVVMRLIYPDTMRCPMCGANMTGGD